MNQKKFSLVSTCRNEMLSLPCWRKDVENQTRKPNEIVIVDAVSSDGTTQALQEWASQDPRLRIHVEKCNPARGRNLAIEMARHEYIVSTDMGVRLDSRWFEEIVRPFEEDQTIQVVIGSCGVDEASVLTAAARAERYLTGDISPFLRTDNGEICLKPGRVPGNLSLAYTRRVWKSIGGLPEDLTLCADDSVFGRQIVRGAFRIAFAPAAIVYWSRHRRLREFWDENLRYGRGDGEAFIKTPISFRLYLRGLLPRCMVPFVTGLRETTKFLRFKPLLAALKNGDWVAIAMMPPLLFGRGFSFGKGYLLGYEHGAIHCVDARNRIKG